MGECHVLGHPRPCRASICEEIESEHEAIRRRTVSAIVAWLRSEVDRMCGRARGSLSAEEAAAWNRQASAYQQASDCLKRGEWKKER